MNEYLVSLSPKASQRGLHTIVAVIEAKSATEAKRKALVLKDSRGYEAFCARDCYRITVTPLRRDEVYFL